MTQQTPDHTVAELEQQLAAARADQAEYVRDELARRESARAAYAEQRIAEYDAHALNREVAEAWRRFDQAVAETPLLVAMAEAHAAERRRIRAGHAHAADLNVLATVNGQRGGHTFDAPMLRELSPGLLVQAVYRLADQIAEAEQEAENDAEIAATAVDLTAEQLETAEQLRELERRRAEVVAHSVNVEGMTEQERAELGLPSGQATGYPNSGGFRPMLGSPGGR